MKTPQYLQAAFCQGWLIIIKVLLFIFASMVLSTAAIAEDPSQTNEGLKSDEQIQIVADKMITNDAQKFAEFIGNVRASQGTFVITSERLRIYFQTDPATTGEQNTSQESIKQVVASDNVHVDTGTYRAKTDRLEYDMETKVIVLLGQNSTLKSKNNILTGSKITIDRKSGQMRVESQPQKQVKAVFYPDQNTEKEE